MRLQLEADADAKHVLGHMREMYAFVAAAAVARFKLELQARRRLLTARLHTNRCAGLAPQLSGEPVMQLPVHCNPHPAARFCLLASAVTPQQHTDGSAARAR